MNGRTKEFKFHWRLAIELHKAGIDVAYEPMLGRKATSFIDAGSFGYVDFLCRKHKWFIECKLKASASEISRALGQCLFYQHFLPGFQGVICFPAEGNELCDFDTLWAICDKHGIILTEDIKLIETVEAIAKVKELEGKL